MTLPGLWNAISRGRRWPWFKPRGRSVAPVARLGQIAPTSPGHFWTKVWSNAIQWLCTAQFIECFVDNRFLNRVRYYHKKILGSEKTGVFLYFDISPPRSPFPITHCRSTYQYMAWGCGRPSPWPQISPPNTVSQPTSLWIEDEHFFSTSKLLQLPPKNDNRGLVEKMLFR